jgi:predicted O-methyltransferase YrrM
MLPFFRLYKFLGYQWQAVTQYYLHSPFVYRFYLEVLLKNDFQKLKPLIHYRHQLKHNQSKVFLTDFGTGSSRSTTVSNLEKIAAVPHKYGKLLFSLTEHFKPQSILEIGTSIGLSSSYMSLANPSSKITSLEGSYSVAQIARQTHAALNLGNIEIIEGEFSSTIPYVVSKAEKFDLIYFDGNHTKEATLQYFEWCLPKAQHNSIFIFDDIYWSPEMNEAWEVIKQHSSVTITIDVYKFGICFFRKEKLAKEDFILRY